MKKVAILGFAESYREAPFDDPSVHIAGMNELWRYLPRWDSWFEMHPRAIFAEHGNRDQAAHLAYLQGLDGSRPVYMLEAHSDIPGSRAYPINEVTLGVFPRHVGAYFTSTVSFMLALAIYQKAEWIGLYGIDLASDTEYTQQRAATEYLIGLAHGMGIEVHVATGSALMKSGRIYGYSQSVHGQGFRAVVERRVADLKTKHEQTLSLVNTLEGALEEAHFHLKMLDAEERGVSLMADHGALKGVRS